MGSTEDGKPKMQATGVTKFENMLVDDLLFIEVFAGSARLSKAAKEVGFQVLPIDKSTARSSQIFIAQYDLATPDAIQALLDLIRTEAYRIVAIHFAPACGTASKAREKRLVQYAKKGFKIPGPLRSADRPMGLDKLDGLDKVRTELANLVYSATAVLAKECIKFNILCSIENPQNSLFWDFPDIVELTKYCKGHSVSFHNCMHGGKRNKLTKWWASDDTYEELRSMCDNSHTHAKWNPVPVGKHLSFPTSDEAAYPALLCKRITAILLKYAKNHGAQELDTMESQLKRTSTTSHRWVLDMLPKGKKYKPLVSEFQQYKCFLNRLNSEPEQSDFFKTLPKGARLVQRQLQWGKLRVTEHNRDESALWVWDVSGKTMQLDGLEQELKHKVSEELFQAELCTIGIPREPWDFLQKAVDVGHPRTMAVHLTSEVMDMLTENFSGDPVMLVKKRAAYLLKWTSRCKELEREEELLHKSMEPYLQDVLAGKRLLVFQEMLNEAGYPDKHLVEDIRKGFRLSGWLQKSNVFPASLKRPAHNLEAALKLAKGVNHSICKQVGALTDQGLELEVWRQTGEELEKGWVWLDPTCNTAEKLLAKRFGLQQGEKVRMIDDCTIGGFNGTCGCSERLKVHAVDEMTAYISWCLSHLPHSSMKGVVGKTYDLKNAYKQYGVHPADREVLRLVVWDPVEKRPRYMGINALPFGAIGSVSAFLRISMAVWFLGVTGLRLCWTAFFDDYTILSKGATARSAAIGAEGLFSLLGIQFAKDGKKAVDWGTLVKTLGVVIDLDPEGSSGRFVNLGHTSNRVQELDSLIQSFLEKGCMSQKDAEKLRGRLQWFEAFAHGRIAQQALRTISGIASSGRTKEALSMLETQALKFLKDRVLTAPPTRVLGSSLKTWLIFSDGACEGAESQQGTIGAVLVSPMGTVFRYFSEVVPQDWMNLFLKDSRHPIFELELLPVWCSLCLWEEFIQSSQCVFYLDNEAARGALVKGATSTPSGKILIQEFVLREMKCQVRVWFSRVPTSSNIADKPSRLEVSELDALGVWRDAVSWSQLRTKLESLGSGDWGFNDGIP